MITASVLLSNPNPLYSRDVLLVFESLVDSFYVFFGCWIIGGQLEDREGELYSYISLARSTNETAAAIPLTTESDYCIMSSCNLWP